jgi:hypothetical protein
MGRAWKPAVSLVAAFAMVCVIGVSRAPRLVAFRDGENSRAEMPDSSINAGGGRIATSLPIIDVSAKNLSQPERRSAGAPFLARPVREKWGIPKAKLTILVPDRTLSSERIAATQPTPAQQGAVVMTHQTNASLTKANAVPVAFTETFFVVVEGRKNVTDQPVFEIQLWRVMVLHPVVDPDSNKIPPKQT